MSEKVLALDWGIKETGAALGERGLPHQLLRTIDSSSRQKLIDKVRVLAGNYKINKILIGLPTHPGNSSKVKKIKGLLEKLGYKTILWEETLTSKKAEEELVKAGYSKKTIRENIHSASAALMLREYLDS